MSFSTLHPEAEAHNIRTMQFSSFPSLFEPKWIEPPTQSFTRVLLLCMITRFERDLYFPCDTILCLGRMGDETHSLTQEDQHYVTENTPLSIQFCLPPSTPPHRMFFIKSTSDTNQPADTSIHLSSFLPSIQPRLLHVQVGGTESAPARWWGRDDSLLYANKTPFGFSPPFEAAVNHHHHHHGAIKAL